MADQCYVYFNNLITIDVIKIDENIDYNFTEASNLKDTMMATTILFNTFDNVLDASYFPPDSSIAGARFTIYKKTPFQEFYDFVCVLDNGEYKFTDFNVVNNQFYHYLAAIEQSTSSGPEFLIYQNTEEDGSLTYLKTNWNQWSICDIEESTEDNIYIQSGNVWNLGINIDGENLTQNLGVSNYDSLGRYPKFSISQKNYSSSNFSGLLGNIKEIVEYNSPNDIIGEKKYCYTERSNFDSFYYRENEKMEEWGRFCSNGKLKLLKDLKGNAWVVAIQSNPSKSINIQSNFMQTTISFDWIEALDISKISIINIGE